MKDQHSIPLLAQLHPKFRGDAQLFIEECEKEYNITIRIVSGFRSFDEQAAIYAQGRTKPGKIVTWAPPGSTYHNYGLAVDVCPFLPDGSNLDWNYDFQHLAVVASQYGLNWGGDFPPGKKDYDHFEETFGLSWRDCYHEYTTKNFIPGTNFITI